MCRPSTEKTGQASRHCAANIRSTPAEQCGPDHTWAGKVTLAFGQSGTSLQDRGRVGRVPHCGRPGSVRVDDGAQHDAAFCGVVVAGTAVHRRPLVPDQEIADLPVGGAKGRDRRPAFDRLSKVATLRKIDFVAAWSVDRLGPINTGSYRHLGEVAAISTLNV